MQIIYCDTCGFRIDESEVKQAQSAGQVICVKCRAAASRAATATGIVARKSSVKITPVAASQKKGESVRKTDAAAHSHRVQAPTGSNAAIGAVIAVVILGGGGAFWLSTRGDKNRPPSAAAAAKSETPKANATKPDLKPKKNESAPAKVWKEPDLRRDPREAMLEKSNVEVAVFEKEADAEFARVARFENLAADDFEGRIKRLKDFIDKYKDAVVASRARIDVERLLKAPRNAPPLNVSAEVLPASLADGVVAHWRFESEENGTLSADFPKGYQGTLAGPSLTDVAAPLVIANARALSFAGVAGEHVKIEPKFSAVTNTFTVSAWVWPEAERKETSELKEGTEGTSAQRYAIFPSQGQATYGEGHAIAGLSIGTNGVSIFEHSDAYLPSVLVQPVLIKGWIHVAMVYDQHLPKLYFNGKLMKTGLASAMTVHPPHQFGDPSSFGPFQGKLDEVRIYDRALTDAEVLALAAAKAVEKK